MLKAIVQVLTDRGEPMRAKDIHAAVEVLGHYQLRLGFNDGSRRDVDLTGELHGPVFEPLADPGFFAQVRVDDELGTVVWPNGADLDPLVLHGDFEPAPRLVHH